MKLDQFKALCDREWENQKGDVVSLLLTPQSAEEFNIDLLLNPDGPHVPGFQTGKLCNPITKSEVEIYRKASRDQAAVRFLVDAAVDHP